MKKIMLALLAFILMAPVLKAQEENTIPDKNLIKVNLVALALKNVTMQYEREISRKTTVALTFRAMPSSTLPFKSVFKSFINDENTKSQVVNFKTGNVAIMPEVRLYLGHQGAYHGFYIAPFLSYAHYSASLPYHYNDNGTDKIIPMAGSSDAFSGGIMLGAQWKISNVLYLDWWILGPHFGFSNGSINGKKELSASEQDALKFYLDDFYIPMVTTTNTVDAHGATVDFSGPWAGVRSGLSLGIRF